jgi:Outer membrane protein and related peptidoglycan-associated (lipo)proteins
MRNRNTQILLVVLAITLSCSGVVFSQDSNALSVAPSDSNTTKVRTVSDGQKIRIEGIVTTRNANTFSLREPNGTETSVRLTDTTNIKTVRKGWFRQDRSSSASDILRGLRLKVEGKGNSDGQLVAKSIRFDEQDLRTAQALESRVDPVETLANSTQALAQNNQARIGEAEKRIDQNEQNTQRLGGQVDELSTIANAAASAAKNPQSTADQAESDAATANARINVLDEYEVLATIAVHFKNGSARLSPAAKAEIDAVATTVSENLNGWKVAVEGYADSRGRTARNHSLSERRAKAVTDYLVTKHGLPPYRVVQPFGFGSSDPIAANNTREGRSLNRRAEIRVLVNKGISSQGNVQAASQEQLPTRP